MANDAYESQKVQALQTLNQTMQAILRELQEMRRLQQSAVGMNLAAPR